MNMADSPMKLYVVIREISERFKEKLASKTRLLESERKGKNSRKDRTSIK
jgi:hypothetical protein